MFALAFHRPELKHSSTPLNSPHVRLGIRLGQQPVQPLLSRPMWRLFVEFLQFLKQEKKWWLIPLVVVLLLLAALIIFSSGSVLAPFMYPFL
jgi:hypothetical protein